MLLPADKMEKLVKSTLEDFKEQMHFIRRAAAEYCAKTPNVSYAAMKDAYYVERFPDDPDRREAFFARLDACKSALLVSPFAV